MPVFDFNSAPEDKKEVQCTYTTFCSNEDHGDTGVSDSCSG